MNAGRHWEKGGRGNSQRKEQAASPWTQRSTSTPLQGGQPDMSQRWCSVKYTIPPLTNLAQKAGPESNQALVLTSCLQKCRDWWNRFKEKTINRVQNGGHSTRQLTWLSNKSIAREEKCEEGRDHQESRSFQGCSNQTPCVGLLRSWSEKTNCNKTSVS